MIEVAVTQHLAHALDARLLTAAHLGINLGDIEDIDTHVVGKTYRMIVNCRAALVIVITRDNQRRLLRELGYTLEHVLRRVARKVRDELVIDRQIGSEHEKLLMPCTRCR